MKTLVIGENATVMNYYTKQAGYGRQKLFVDLHSGKEVYRGIYIKDVFPNIHEHFSGQAILSHDAFYKDELDYSTDINGNGEYTFDMIFETTDELLNYVLSGHEVSIEGLPFEEEE